MSIPVKEIPISSLLENFPGVESMAYVFNEDLENGKTVGFTLSSVSSEDHHLFEKILRWVCQGKAKLVLPEEDVNEFIVDSEEYISDLKSDKKLPSEHREFDKHNSSIKNTQSRIDFFRKI